MKIGLDVHGVVDTFPRQLGEFAKNLIAEGHEVHIITGQEQVEVEPLVKSLGVPFTHFFSVVDYNKSIGTDITVDKRGTCWMDKEIWESTKGNYCESEGIDMLIDNSPEYMKYMPDSCSFMYLPKDGNLDFLRFIY